MRFEAFAIRRGFRLLAVTASTIYVLLFLFPEPANAIPVFARKYQTACATCHAGFPKLNGVGLAFKMNGYRFSQDDEEKVKQPPLQLGNDSYRDTFPNSILPSNIPMMPPIAFEFQQLMTTNLPNAKSTPSPGPASPDFNFPTQVNLLSAGTVTKHISYWANFGLAQNGWGSGSTFEPNAERVFFIANNLFAVDDEEDENGFHLAPRGFVLPKHFLNLKVGQFEPYVIAPYANTLRSVGITGRLTGSLTVGSNTFAFEPEVRGVEAYGFIRNYTSWCAGLVDGSGQSGPSSNNSHQDMYARVGHKWWGYPLDGRVVSPRKPTAKSDSADASDSNTKVRAQNSDDLEEDNPTPWLDYYRQTQFETGFFGYTGRNGVSPLSNPYVFSSPQTAGMLYDENFSRIGADFQWQHEDLHILGTYMFGHDSNAGTAASLYFNTWFLEANYYFKPWIIGYARYEELQFMQPGFTANNIQRAVPGVAFYPILNFAVRTEFVIDTSGKGTTPNQFLIEADYAF